jgi:hypothetical protein
MNRVIKKIYCVGLSGKWWKDIKGAYNVGQPHSYDENSIGLRAYYFVDKYRTFQ